MVIVARYFPNAEKLSLWRFEMRKILVFMMLSGVAFGQSGNRTSDPINAQSVNYVKFVGVGNYSTVQLALTDACAQNGGFGVVEIEQGATPADAPTLGGTASYTINGCTNSSGGVLIRDERSSAGANCYVYSNSTTYVQGACSSSSSSGYLLTLAKVNAVTTFGTFNTTLGSASLPTSSTGSSNSAYGYSALGSLTTGQNNIAVGAFSLNSDITASDNTAVGVDALFDVTGIENTAIGWQAGNSLTSGTTSTFVGYNAEPAGATDTNETVVGGGAIGNGSNTATIGNSSVTSGYIGSNQICLVTGTGCKAGFITNPMTTLGDTIYGGASGVPTRLAGVTTTSVAGSVLVSNGVSSAATAPQWISYQGELDASNLTVGTVNIASGTTQFLLYNNGGKLGNTNALPNGTTATTQSAFDTSTKVATTAYADLAVSANATYAFGGLSTNVIAKGYSAPGAVTNSSITDNGTTVTTTEVFKAASSPVNNNNTTVPTTADVTTALAGYAASNAWVTWTPTDVSGGNLTLTSALTCETIAHAEFCHGFVTYPATIDTNNAKIGGLPVTSSNSNHGIAPAVSSISTLICGQVNGSSSNINFYTLTGIGFVTNAQLSGATVYLSFFYQIP